MEIQDESNCKYWQDLSQNVKVEKLLNEGCLADCKFVVGPVKEETKTIHGHKIMFIFESPVFEKLFDGNFSEAKKLPEVRIEDFYPEDFKNFCFLIYYHNARSHLDLFAKYSIKEIIEIYRICHKYMTTSILKKCLDYIQAKLDSLQLADTILLFELAHELNDKVLLRSVEKAISKKNSFFDKQLIELSPEIFYNYIVFLSTLELKKPSAAQMFCWINDYILKNNLKDKENEALKEDKKDKAEDKKRFCYINKFLNLVNFKQMTYQEFINGPGKSELFDWKFKYELIIQLLPKY